MLPISLRLRNFLSYGENTAELDFRGISLACLTGDNGVGKSSLLEAITWAVWGSARMSSDDDLIRIGSIDMEVEFVFSVEDVQYRVIRKRSRKRKAGVSTLEFQIDHDGTWRSLTEPTIRATQQKIISVIGMGYETFVNSAFLRQGHADEFTVKRPNERKAILSEILGLQYYDTLVDAARVRARAAEVAMHSTALFLERSTEAQDDIAALGAEQEAAVRMVTTMQTTAEQINQALQQLRSQLTEAVKSVARAEALERQIAQADRARTDTAKLAQSLEMQRDAVQIIVRAKKEIERDMHAYEEAATRYQQLHDKQIKRTEVSERRAALIRALDERMAAITQEMQSIEGQKVVLKETTKRASTAKLELRDIEAKLQEVTQIQHSIDALGEKIQGIQSDLAASEERGQQLERDGKKVKEQKDRIETADAECPTCQQELTGAHRTRVIKQLTEAIDSLRQEYGENRNRRHALQEELSSLTASLSELKKSLITFEQLKEREGMLRATIGAQEEVKAKLALLEQRLNVLRMQQEQDPTTHDLSQRIVTCDRELTMLAVDDQEIRAVRARVEQLQQAPRRYDQLKHAHTELGTITKQLTDVQVRLKEYDRELQALVSERGSLDILMKRKSDLDTVIVQREDELRALRSDLQEGQMQVQRIHDTIARHHAADAQRAEQRTQLERLRTEHALYEELAEAFGKRGIQAMIIDAAVPEIEQEANEILSRMTGNQMHITFELQKEKKTGEGSIETLEIKISDDIGTRPYELYSGGEAFRINFAIRVALSRLLAQRAGAKLRMLIIDEGFGTQDQIGRDHLVAAIRAIRTDFDKIIVITHIPELKDAFSERIQIVKTPLGSQIVAIS